MNHPFALPAAVVLAATLTCPAARADEDPWFGPDKSKHFGASAAIAIGGYSFGAAVFDERGPALLLGGSLAVSAGLGKEAYDAAGQGDPSERDLVWDLAGTAVGLGLAFVVDVLLRGGLDDDPERPPGETASPSLGLRF